MNVKVLVLVIALLSQVNAGPIGAGICYAGKELTIYSNIKLKLLQKYTNFDLFLLKDVRPL